ncbi:hypothetical protein [Aromatoleum aromaticum]|uniref:hypothetical protein n=1 Tax=Aromatoleum aromaticum TaxID=551760 RepID=UPI001B7D0AEA|nr:hypothetical protein [Aromatoleum aromaticum]
MNKIKSLIISFPMVISPILQAGEIKVIEFYNSNLNHYFVTNPIEAASIDNGAAGPGWTRTGQYFYGSDVPADGYFPVCRFYTMGANSHFYTAQESECNYLKSLNSGNQLGVDYWTYEGIAFYAKIPQGETCPANEKKVYRLYNNLGNQGDSNHRYTTDQTTVNIMKSKGWILEGTAICGATTPAPLPPTEEQINKLIDSAVENIKIWLRSPSSMQVIGEPSWRISSTDPTKGTISIEFDAQNGFGALIRNRALCGIEYDERGYWKNEITSQLSLCFIY